jgi:long-subunit acyl-CoA synthetase (AMP-forming)
MFLGVPLLFNKVLAGILRGVKEKGSLVYALIRAMMGLSGLIKRLTGVNPGKKLFHTILEKASLSTIRVCISGGGPLAPSVFKAYNQLGIDFIQGYGLTETSPILTLNPKEAFIITSVGKLIPGVEMTILEPDVRLLQRMFHLHQAVCSSLTHCIEILFLFAGSFFLVATLMPLHGKASGTWTRANASNPCRCGVGTGT